MRCCIDPSAMVFLLHYYKLFKHKQELLIHGYVKENYKGAAVPHAILSLISKRHGKEPKLIINQTRSDYKIHLELYLDRNPNKLLNIVEYQCEYNIEELSAVNNPTICDHKVVKSPCFDDIHCFSHLGIEKVENYLTKQYVLQCIGLDINKNILIKSEIMRINTRRITRYYNWRDCKFELIDTKGNNNVNYEAWMEAMNRLNINMDELIYKRVFWYLYFQNRREGVDKDALVAFLVSGFRFTGQYSAFAKKLKDVLK